MYDKWLDLLTAIKLFQNIEKDELNNMLCCLAPSIKTFNKKENITLESSEFKGIGILLQGEALITKENAAGDRVIIDKLEAGDIFGEMIAFSNKKYWLATVVASTYCTVLFLPPEKIVGNCPRMCAGHKMLIRNMLNIVSQKALNLHTKLEYLTLKSIRAKISTYLLEYYKKTNKLTFTIALNRNELADFLNISRPSLSRELIKMRDEGILDFYRSSFKILDVELLRNCLK